MTNAQPVDSIRRQPRQSRSQTTVAAIFEATARILNAKGSAGLNTNAIAELAGISIGTLYQYFPNKNAILIALARQELKTTSSKVVDSLGVRPWDGPSASSSHPAHDPARAAVRALLQAFGGRQRTRKALIEAMIANGLSEELARPAEAVMKAILARFGSGANPAFPPLRLFVLTRAVVGLIRAAVMEQSPWLDAPEFEEEMVCLIYGYLSWPSPPAATPAN